MNSPKRILFSGNDPGGANAILPVVEALVQGGYVCEGMITGPAWEIFTRHKITCRNAEGISDAELFAAVDTFAPDLFLAGTSGSLTADKKILLHFAGRIPSVYVLDFWNNYWQRFSGAEKDLKYLPTAVCVMDELAEKEMLAEGIPASAVRVTGNPHFEHFSRNISRADENEHTILFISQPISDASGMRGAVQYGFDEFKVLKSIIAALSASLRLSIRLHPREDSHKYDAFLNERVRISTEPTLEKALSRAGLVVGMFSPVLIQAAIAGKNVLSYQPGFADVDPLPTNKLGITKRAVNKTELTEFLASYERGENPGIAHGVKDFFAKGATGRVCDVIMQLLEKK